MRQNFEGVWSVFDLYFSMLCERNDYDNIFPTELICPRDESGPGAAGRARCGMESIGRATSGFRGHSHLRRERCTTRQHRR